MPIATSSQTKNFIRLNLSDDVIIEAHPLVTRLMDPGYIMATLGRSSFMSNHSDKLVISSIKTLSMGSVKDFVMFLILCILFLSLSSLTKDFIGFFLRCRFD
jgi:hypothetical protein